MKTDRFAHNAQGCDAFEEKLKSKWNASSCSTGQVAGAETNKCGICSSEVVNRGVLDCCAHWFCFACIDDWATVTNLCPLCKARFRFITCLPVAHGDLNDPDNIGAGFAKRVDGSADDETSFPFSFPSYFIDEEAVVCLDGDACRVRAGLPSLEMEGALAADTSVACDLCDCWYHAGCVHFDPEQSSFYCPRCIASQEKPRNSWQSGVESGTRISSEARASSLVGLLPPAEKELSYGGGTVLGSTSVAIAVAEKGESAVSLSMRRIPVQPSAQQIPPPYPKRREERKEVMWSPIREPVKAPKNYGPMWSPIREPLNISQNYELWSPTPGPVNADANDEELWSPTPESERASGSIFKEEPIPTPESERASGSTFKEEPIPTPAFSGTSSAAASDSTMCEKIVPEVPTSHKIAVLQTSTSLAAGPSSDLSSKRPGAATRGSDVTGVEMDSSSHIAPKAKSSQKMPEGFASPAGGVKKDETTLIDGDSLHTATNAVEQLKKGKRKALQEDERRIDSKDLPVPPRKVGRKSTKTSDAVEGRNLAVSKDSSSNAPVEEIVGDRPDSRQSKDRSSGVIVQDEECEEVPTEETAMEQVDGDDEQADKRNSIEGDLNSHVDVMDIVSDPRKRLVREGSVTSSNQKGVRTRIIMHRETDAKNAVGAGLIDRIRQQMKATAGYIGGEDLSKVGVSDDRFLAAFKAALLSSREKSKEAKSTGSAHGKSMWLSKILNRKSQGKGSRDSLTRKLYAGGTGRWDRDWDIAFWKERSTHLRKAQKDAEDEIKSLGMMIGKQGRGDDNLPEEEDPIFSRIYIADTSLFPRNDDVQLLSAKVTNSAEGGGNPPQHLPIEKGSSLLRDVANSSANKNGAPYTRSLPDGRGSKINSSPISKDGSVLGKGSQGGLNVGLGGKLGSSPKLPAKAGSAQPQVSAPLVTPPTQSSTLNSDVKKDKRQWALEVLARKTGSSSNGSTKATGSADIREGQFSLLVQLPTDMRPLVQHNRHSKVPTAVRQVQLNRIVEQEMRRAKLADIGNSRECEETVKRAKAREEELYKKSNSRGVYVNLCVRSLAQTDTAAARAKQQEVEVHHSDAIQSALVATGLVESPPASPSRGEDDDRTPAAASTTTDPKAAAPVQDSTNHLKDSSAEKWVDNVLEMVNVDNTYSDLELNLSNDLDDTIFSESLPSAKAEAPPAVPVSVNGIKKMTVVLSTTPNTALEPAKALPVTPLATPQPKDMTQDSAPKVDPLPTAQVSLQARSPMEDDHGMFNGATELKLTAVPTISKDSVLMSKDPSVHSVSLAPLKEIAHKRPANPDRKSSTRIDGEAAECLETDDQNLSDASKKAQSPPPPSAAVQDMDDWMNSGKFADLDRRIEDIRQSNSPSANRGIDVPWSSHRTNAELAYQNDLLSPQQSVQKQVEIYVNQHLKPLYRSGVINADQFRYAVSKTAAKVMEHHENATSADFLIAEGSKVKKLADQYLQNFMKRKVR